MSSAKSKVKTQKVFKISRKKLCLAIEKLNNLSAEPTRKRKNFTDCNIGIIKQLNTSANVQPIEWRPNWVKLFTTSATRHDWDNFMKTLRLASQNHNFGGVENILRNSFFGVLTLPIYKDEKTLRLLLYTIAPCRNEHDIDFCIKTILRTFDDNRADN
uniref:Uncharacterized protein n=1 Tax=Anopheles minimus TaxID=112268 RepID=A0A182WEW3_9DIPT